MNKIVLPLVLISAGLWAYGKMHLKNNLQFKIKGLSFTPGFPISVLYVDIDFINPTQYNTTVSALHAALTINGINIGFINQPNSVNIAPGTTTTIFKIELADLATLQALTTIFKTKKIIANINGSLIAANILFPINETYQA